ncbi:glycosyltransferase family 4 protein [Anaeromyxobacter diazotrophicus]|uniref:Glycosyl transferase n=1 Tax=Anaeromyxobacter diazotrophicus TaxID=2590199 RepID=A0A7I9VN27_9BACT|nr:glycosyltransferase family 4 protein [Anaeromyxobacter diazotrophicus]GEJ57618.1 glycosyl transferase [Anaeromyxobacter diazotrophicus]
MSGRRRIAFVVPDLQLGGAERQVVDLVNHLDHERFEATLFTFEAADDLGAAVDPRVRRVRALRRSRFDTGPVDQLARLLREERTELVHCTLQMALLVARGAIHRSGRGLPLVEAIHTTQNRGRRLELADRLLYVPLMSGCDRVITVCDAQRRFWASKYPALRPKLVTVPNGIDLDRYRDDVPAARKAALRRELGVEGGELVLGMVAAIRPEKNHAGILEAAARLAEGGHRVKLLFAGGAPDPRDEERLRRRTRELGLGERVRWLGSLRDPRELISILDAGILFSTAESLPLALLECLAMGKPVVAAAIGGVSEIVVPGENGLLVAPRDTAAFASAVARLAADRELLRGLSARARPSVEARFSVQQMARRTEAVLEEVLDGRAGARAGRRARAAAAPQEDIRRRA